VQVELVAQEPGDLVGAGLTLFTAAHGADRLHAVDGRAPVTLLVRPDGASAGWLAPSAEALAA
jgi:hypothetical protein